MEYFLPLTSLLLLVLGFPIYLVLLTTTVGAVLFFVDLPLGVLHQTLFGSIDKFALLAVPYYIFAGEIMVRGGMARRIVDFVMALIGFKKGSLGLTTIGASTFFGAVSGSAPATIAAVGSITYQPMIEAGYGKRYAAGVITSAGAIATIIPPSISMILYGISTETSIVHLFMAGVLPGLLIMLIAMAGNFLLVQRMQTTQQFTFCLKNIAKTAKDGSWGLGMPVIVLGGIYMGVVSPTEAAGIACIYSIIVTMFIQKEMDLATLWDCALVTIKLTAVIIIIVACSGAFSWIVTIEDYPYLISEFIEGLNMSPWVFFITVNLLLLGIGCFMDTASAILIVAPILAPIALLFGMDPIHFGVIMTVNLAIGMFTPPIGLNIFVSQAVLRIGLKDIYLGVMPFFLFYVVALLIITFFPDISMYLTRFV